MFLDDKIILITVVNYKSFLRLNKLQLYYFRYCSLERSWGSGLIQYYTNGSINLQNNNMKYRFSSCIIRPPPADLGRKRGLRIIYRNINCKHFSSLSTRKGCENLGMSEGCEACGV